MAFVRSSFCADAGAAATSDMAVDANDDVIYFSVTGPDTAQLSEGQTLQPAYGPRNMGAGPSGLRSMNLKTGEVKVEKIWIAHDGGRAINPLLVIGQTEGGVYMGLGEALMEAAQVLGLRIAEAKGVTLESGPPRRSRPRLQADIPWPLLLGGLGALVLIGLFAAYNMEHQMNWDPRSLVLNAAHDPWRSTLSLPLK